MEKERLDKVMQDILHIDYGTKIRYHYKYHYNDTYDEYIYDENGLNCTSRKQGCRSDYIIVGMLLNNDADAEIVNTIDYKQCWNDMKTFLKTNVHCEGLKASVLLSNMKVWEEENEVKNESI